MGGRPRKSQLESAAAWALAIFRNDSETCAAFETSLQNLAASSRSGVEVISERATASASRRRDHCGRCETGLHHTLFRRPEPRPELRRSPSGESISGLKVDKNAA